ncbi:DUF2157 domain-containing protein [Paenibacillus filicis]|uniref:DUF2157 domain-containing protein n=1 Tax=Paenibacillus gyeongsangnamensis TaxID=3388067 RepID=A0ABT4QCT7_9BACL|nr:DUF2157 domain-containing protein [Paenibacillus filicis]MCZ8514666.1 DUF2157 domain-containing protein [Paenibacillus filicis]
MSRKWVEQESPLWVEKGIITREQADRILDLYEDRKHAVGLLPILGSILVGLGILSFVAANWQSIPQLLRLALMIIVMAGFYVSGETAVRRGHGKLGIALIGLGVVSFGGSIVLIGQMFHLVAFHAGSFVLWAVAGAAAAFLYRSRYLYLISLILFNAAQIYSVSQFQMFSYTAFLLMVLALGYYGWKWRNTLLVWSFSLSFTLHALLWVIARDIKFIWMFIPAMALYALGDWLKDRTGAYALQIPPLAAAFLFGIYLVIFPSEWSARFLSDLRAEPLYYMGALAILFGVSLAGKLRTGRAPGAFEWILLFPFLYLPGGIELAYLLSLFLFSLYVLWRGYAEEWRFKINFGTVLFITSTLVAYGKLTWDFMDKSLFFIIGGLLLLSLSWFLNRRKKQFFYDVKEETPHD